MKNQLLLGLFLTSIIFFASPAFAALTINEVNDANVNLLANEILGAGTSSLSGTTYTGFINNSGSQFGTTGYYSQAGIFTGGLSSGLDFDSGIFLSTGYVLDDFSDGNLSSDLAGVGVPIEDPDLNSLLPPNTVTRDATTLEFTFDFAGGDLVFNYIFASTEYSFANDPLGRFNDIFGFFLEGPSIDGNIALTDTIPYISVDNTLGSLDPDPNDILFSGFTTMLTATAANLAAGTYTAKIGITDVTDGLFDSGVFIQSNSFSDGPVPVPLPFSALLFASGLFGLAGTKRILKRS